jgi:hypothetical protein
MKMTNLPSGMVFFYPVNIRVLSYSFKVSQVIRLHIVKNPLGLPILPDSKLNLN